MENFATRLKRMRKERGLTQQQASNGIGINIKKLASYEENRATPPPDLIIRIARFFKCTTDYLLGVEVITTVSIIGSDLIKNNITEN